MGIFGWSGSDIISGLACQGAPNEYRHGSSEFWTFQIIINKAAQHFKSLTLSSSNRQEGQGLLKDCQNVLQDLNSLIERYNNLASANTTQVLKRGKLGTEEIATLRARLISNISLLNSFIERYEFLEIQARLTDVLGLSCTNARVSMEAISSFARSTNTKEAFKEFCKTLFEIGVTSSVISQNKCEILNICKPLISAQINNSNTASQSQSPANRSRFGWLRPQIDFLVGPLMLSAATAGNTHHFISILKYTRNINFEDNRKETALHKAAGGDHKDILHLLLEKGASIAAINTYNNTPLHLAARNGHTSIVELLLEKGASIEAMGEDNNTPLHLAAQGGHASTVRLLLEKGASAEAINWFNKTPLHLVSQSDYTSTAELLLDTGVSIEAPVRGSSNTPLHLAAENGYTRMVELLLDNDASVEAKNWYGKTPLHLAAQSGHTSTVELLLEKGALIEAINPYNDTPLHFAAESGRTGTAELLLRKGASVEATNEYSNTPLHLAARNGHTGIVELLCKRGASVEAPNDRNYVPLDYAIECGHTDIARFLKTETAKLVNHGCCNVVRKKWPR